MKFRKGRPRNPLPDDAHDRQVRAVVVARAALGSVEAAREFLNSHHPELDARPIDLAVASDAGLDAVEAALRRHGGSAPGGG